MSEAGSLTITDSSQVGEGRRLALNYAAELGFPEEARGRVALIVTEAAHNLVRHARAGELVFTKLRAGGGTGLRVLALDVGPGMANPADCLRDGHSTSGTAGEGLGAIQRLSSSFQIHSLPGVGTAVLAEVWPKGKPRFPSLVEAEGIALPHRGEETCGDAWARKDYGGRCQLIVADGLGHGQQAAEASREAVRCFLAAGEASPAEVLARIHAELRTTRGAAVAVAELDPTGSNIRFAGIGNIAGSIVSVSGTTHMVSHNGTVGHRIRKVQEFLYPWPAGGLVVLHSDGLTSQWRLGPGLSSKPAALVAGVLYRDFRRERDDVTVVVARANPLVETFGAERRASEKE